MQPFIHLFDTPKNFYFYDVNKNENVRIEQDLYKYLHNMLHNPDNFIVNDLLEEKLKDLKDGGYLSNNTVRRI
ncbi:hypothetical protein [Tissierella praeacuta]|uniref:hypothetical protein n=1 Tax=Tissierella praeacuta TaxID=43131 RepID=UPI00333FEDA3